MARSEQRDLEGKVALVTGGGRNVGRAISMRLAADGAFVVVNYFRSPEPARHTVAAIEQAGGQAIAIRASVAQQSQRDSLFAQIDDRFGRLDVLVNNAAYGALVPDDEVTDELLDRALDTNLKGGLGCARAAARLMERSGGGSIVNLSTLGGGNLVMANYLACGPAKAAVEALTRYLAVDFASRGIRVNTAAAGLIESEVVGLFPDAEAMQRAVVAATPMGRLGTPEEFAEVVSFLASPRSSWITGHTLLADGGLSLGAALLSPATSAAAPVEAPTTNGDATKFTAGVVEDAQAEIDDEIVVVGMGVAVSGADNPEDFWRQLRDGADLFVTVPPDRWDNGNFHHPDHSAVDKTYSRHSAFITDFTPDAALAAEQVGGAMESTTLWLRHALRQALAGVSRTDADVCSFQIGYTADGSQHLEEAMVRAGIRTRVADALPQVGVSSDATSIAMGALDEALERTYPRGGPDPVAYLPNSVALNAMAGILPAQTDLLVIDTACSSSLYTVDLGMKGLLDGRHDIAVCGGAFALGPRGSILFAKLNGLSESGEVRSLDASSDGVLFADGAAVVVLKRLSRALADGDEILASLASFGSSSDGKGKAIYAPSPTGQKLAIARARQDIDHIAQPDWIVAHATGTPAGDLAEFTTLREMTLADRPVNVTSNKAVIGHTGWAAGAASLIEVVLGLKHQLIPAQHRFTAAPKDFAIDESCLQISTQAVPWPRRDAQHRRVAAISGFGFGGTNAHLVVQDPPPPGVRVRAAPVPVSTPRLAIVAATAHAPGDLDAAALISAVDAATMATTFGAHYPLPPFDKVRMPPGLLRSIDRCQLMILECAHRLRATLGDFWEAERATTGVVLGHMGATRNATLYATRCYLDDIEARLPKDGALTGAPWLPAALRHVADDVRSLVPASNENSFPGMMPNVIPARVANYFDLKGLNMTVDTGFTSALSALDVASRYLAAGDISVALVGGINGNATPEISEILESTLFGSAPAEAAFLFALTTEETARAAGLTILGLIDPVAADGKDVACGPTRGRRTSFLGADGAFGLLRALESSAAGEAATVTCAGGHGPDMSVTITPEHPASSVDRKVRRHVQRAVPDSGTVVAATSAFWPDEPVIVISDEPALTVPSQALLLGPDTNLDSLAAVLDGFDPTHAVRHLRVVTRATDTVGPSPTVHDLLFLVVQQRFDALDRPGASVFTVMLDAFTGDAPRPVTGLFTGLHKVVHLELTTCLSFALLTSAVDANAAIAQAERESALSRRLSVIHYRDGHRYGVRVLPAPATPSKARLNAQSVVLAVGGGRGITAELLEAVAQEFSPHIVVIGSNRLDAHPAAYLAMSDADFMSSRSGFIRVQLSENPGTTPAQANARFQRVSDARSTLRNLDRMKAHCGNQRVTYIACDVRNETDVRDAVRQALAVTGTVDLLINASGLNRSAPLRTKAFAEFRRIRDLKLDAYRNLKDAFAATMPGLWVNFGSLLGVTGQVGEADYASANDFLAAASGHAYATGAHETTIAWTLWGEVGLGANELTKAYFEKSGMYSAMSNAEGVHHFLNELSADRLEPLTVHLGDNEQAAVERLLPGFLVDSTNDHRSPFFLERALHRDERSAVFEHDFAVTSNPFLAHHLVAGAPTLPGTFVTEVAFEAAAALVPDLLVYALDDLTFHRFLKVRADGTPAPHRIEARLVERRDDLRHALVEVKVFSDVIAPNGTVLRRDRLHFSTTVRLAATLPEAPVFESWPALRETSVIDPYHCEGSPVLLTGPFVSTTATRLHPRGKRSTYDLQLPSEDPVFSRFNVPTILLDGLARTGVLAVVKDGLIPLAAPLSIRRINLFEHTNDTRVVSDYGHLDLYAVVDDAGDGSSGAFNEFSAVRPDGRVLVQMRDMQWTLLGLLDPEKGDFMTPAQAELTAAGAR